MTRLHFFDWYARHVWALQRRVTTVRLAERCHRCVLSERASALENGTCGECLQERTAAPQPNHAAADEFHDLMRRTHANGPFDVLMLLSGGKDSAWLLHHVRTRYPDLRMLCVLVDNGFLSPIARRNAEHVAATLGVPLLIDRPEPIVFGAPLREAFLKARQQGSYGTVDLCDGDLTHSRCAALAKGARIPRVLSGLSWAQVERIFGVSDFCIDDFATPILCPFWAWRMSEDDILRDVLRSGLLTPADVNPLATNHALVPLMACVDVLNLGFNTFEPEFCAMIREGKADLTTWRRRFEFAEYCARTGYLLAPAVRQSLWRLGLTGRELGIAWAT